jgi:DNA-binding NarL/FixJ family response regulator
VLPPIELVLAGLTALFAGRHDLQVLPASGAEESFDLVLLDPFWYAWSDACELTRSLRAQGVPVLVFTGRCDPVTLASLCSLGASGLLCSSAPRLEIVRRVTAEAGAPTNEASAVRPDLSTRERAVLAGYASGAKAVTVARQVGLTVDSVNTYVARVRRKYEAVGRPATSRIDLYRLALEDGILEPQSARAAPVLL